MRERKYRVWSEIEKKWIYSQEMGWSCPYLDISYFWKWVSGNPGAKVYDWTGLIDKKRKDIYEGDILNISDSDSDVEEYITDVRFLQGSPSIDFNGGDYDITPVGYLPDNFEIEVIGNIHENEVSK